MSKGQKLWCNLTEERSSQETCIFCPLCVLFTIVITLVKNMWHTFSEVNPTGLPFH